MRLDELSRGRTARVDHIDWSRLTPADGQRLREFGLCEGAEITLLHRGSIFGGALACRIGRMTIAMRASHARAIDVASHVGGTASDPVAEGVSLP